MNLEQVESVFNQYASGVDAGVRQQALSALLEHGFPTRRNELWKYTKIEPLATFALDALSSPATDDGANTTALNASLDEQLAPLTVAGRLLFVDGVLDASAVTLPDGVTLDATPTDPGALRHLHAADHALVMLNAAMPSAALTLTVDEGVQVDGGLHIVHRTTRAGALSQAQINLHLHAGSQLTLTEHFDQGTDEAAMHNTVLVANIREDARLRCRRLQALGANALQVTRIEAELSANAALDTMTLDVGGQTVRNDINVRLNGAGARVDMRGIYLGNDRQHIDNHTRVDHIARDTISREDYRGILRDHCHGVFNGKVFVHEGADGTDAAQSNPNLLLSDHAEIDTKPELEIYADDVKCAHGATVGQLDQTSLFYLRSRGIDEPTAIQLLTYAFCREALAGIEEIALRARMERLVAEQIPDFSALELIE